jgi:hypothetical protein
MSNREGMTNRRHRFRRTAKWMGTVFCTLVLVACANHEVLIEKESKSEPKGVHQDVQMASKLKSEPAAVEILIPSKQVTKDFFADCKKVWTVLPIAQTIRNRIQAEKVQRYILLELGSITAIGYDAICLAQLQNGSTVLWMTRGSDGRPINSVREVVLFGPDLDDYLNLLGKPVLPARESWPGSGLSVAEGMGYFFEWKNAGTTTTASVAPGLMAPNDFHHPKGFGSTGDDRYDELVTKLRATKEHLEALVYRH